MAEKSEELENLLTYLKTTRGFDFTGYKRSTLERRVTKRMEAVGVRDLNAYLDHLEVHPDEFSVLFNTILINVTAFFRDPDSWDYLATEIIPRLVESKEPDSPVRVWSAGCASGEEPFTVAMLLAEALGVDAYCRRVKIYATDVDEEALEQARHGIYTAEQVDAVPEELRNRYFDRLDQRFSFRKDLRRTVIFGRNDLIQDAPISRVDLLVCRNALMYFNAETQSHILRRFHFALQQTGYLFLGKSEMLLSRGELFLPVNLKRRVFMKVMKAHARERLAFPQQTMVENGDDGPEGRLRESAFDSAPIPQLVVDRDRTLLLTNQAARRVLSIQPTDIHRPIKDLEVSYRPSELRSGLDAAFDGERLVTQGPVAHLAAGEERTFEVRLEPLHVGGTVAAVSVTYVDLTSERKMEQELERSKHELGAAYEELQSTVEELETTNEELQSTNEELETMNEELQSSNEELETTNDELRQPVVRAQRGERVHGDDPHLDGGRRDRRRP